MHITRIPTRFDSQLKGEAPFHCVPSLSILLSPYTFIVTPLLVLIFSIKISLVKLLCGFCILIDTLDICIASSWDN